MPPEIFQKKILTWFELYGRKGLPWQKNITPYRVWVSEIMLQQTQVATVIPYFNQFISQFPDIGKLATAPEDLVLRLWSGLGYYARARNLHKTAKTIYKNGNNFPGTLESLLELPGIGRSTAGAILSIAFNNSHPILDGNVRRVLARYRAIYGWTGHTKVNKELWAISTHYTPTECVAKYTQAIMDLGATLCTRSKPQCNKCPITHTCTARIQGIVHELPTAKPKKNLLIKKVVFLIIQNSADQILFERRPNSGIWGGLWSFPEFNSYDEIQSWCQNQNSPIQSVTHIEKKRHTFSHYHLDFTTCLVKIENNINNVMEANRHVWYKVDQIDTLGLPAPIKKLIHEVVSDYDKNG